MYNTNMARKMFKKERKEHPTLSVTAVKTIVKDHMKLKRR